MPTTATRCPSGRVSPKQQMWHLYSGNMKGSYSRQEEEYFSFSDITTGALSVLASSGKYKSMSLDLIGFVDDASAELFLYGELPDKKKETRKKMIESARDVIRKISATPGFNVCFQKKVLTLAKASHESGQLLFGIAPDLTVEKALKLFEDAFRKASKVWVAKATASRLIEKYKIRNTQKPTHPFFKSKPKEEIRYRVKDWLNAISLFEDGITKDTVRIKSSVFNAYKTQLDSVSFSDSRFRLDQRKS